MPRRTPDSGQREREVHATVRPPRCELESELGGYPDDRERLPLTFVGTAEHAREERADSGHDRRPAGSDGRAGSARRTAYAGLEGRKAAVDRDELTRDVARVVAQEEHDGRRDLPCGSLATERYRRTTPARSTRGGRVETQRSVDQSRRDELARTPWRAPSNAT